MKTQFFLKVLSFTMWYTAAGMMGTYSSQKSIKFHMV